jgi:hypothetical protein
MALRTAALAIPQLRTLFWAACRGKGDEGVTPLYSAGMHEDERFVVVTSPAIPSMLHTVPCSAAAAAHSFHGLAVSQLSSSIHPPCAP